MTMTDTNLQLRSLVREDSTLEISLAEVEMPQPGPDEVLVKIEATPINPSDLALLTAFADMGSASVSGTADRPVVTAPISKPVMAMVASRVGQSLPVGNEGAGEVVEAGSSDAAQALLGKTVGLIGGEMYARYRCVNVQQCLPMRDGISAVQAASFFVNPMTVLAMVETMRMEGHTALVHTAAASNLGQMLNRVCQADGIALVNIVRRTEQETLLRDLGAEHVVNSSSPDFLAELTEAVAVTGATVAFDATGGGKLASQILGCMEAAAARSMTEYDRYGTATHKQLYIYGGLDQSPTILKRNFGFAWSVSGWLLPHVLQKISLDTMQQMRTRIANEIDSTFASHYTREVSLTEALGLEAIGVYCRQATGEKVLIRPG
jgi:NADPH2:quinone reductase